MSHFEINFRRIFGSDQNLIDENDPRARQIQKDLDAEHERQARSERQVWYPPGTMAPRTMKEIQSDGELS